MDFSKIFYALCSMKFSLFRRIGILYVDEFLTAKELFVSVTCEKQYGCVPSNDREFVLEALCQIIINSSLLRQRIDRILK